VLEALDWIVNATRDFSHQMCIVKWGALASARCADVATPDWGLPWAGACAQGRGWFSSGCGRVLAVTMVGRLGGRASLGSGMVGVVAGWLIWGELTFACCADVATPDWGFAVGRGLRAGAWLLFERLRGAFWQ
jgi:hypothetical protein